MFFKKEKNIEESKGRDGQSQTYRVINQPSTLNNEISSSNSKTSFKIT